MAPLKKKHILIGVCGGIAAYKIPYLVRLLIKEGAEVKVVVTEKAKQFVSPLVLSTLSKNPVVFSFIKEKYDTIDWNNHIALAHWADLVLFAPITANTLAKMSTGLADNLLLAIYLSSKSQIFIAPAMDLEMYQHPTTSNNIKQLKSNGTEIINPEFGELASGLTGHGRMATPENIVTQLIQYYIKDKPLKNKTVLITAGPTVEPIDSVRYISNFSTGKMGVELANRALELGANVKLVIGPNTLSIENNQRLDIDNVTTSDEMYKKTYALFPKVDLLIMAAAVSDYKTPNLLNYKLKKKEHKLPLVLEPTKDILKALAHIKSKQFVIGFALETDNEIENAIHKLKQKKLDAIILNSTKDSGAGFKHDTNKITIIDKQENILKYDLKLKKMVAIDIFNFVLKTMPL